MPICSNCGNTVPDGTRFCTTCGTPIPAPAVNTDNTTAQSASYSPQTYQPAYQQAPNYTPEYTYGKPSIGSIFDFYNRAFATLSRKPIRLWGLSLLHLFITGLINSLGALVPIITLPITLILNLGFKGVLLDGYHGKNVRSEQLFQGFRKDVVVRNGAGMCWMALWQMIWAFVPIMNIVKSYSYCFVPYILLTDKDITATEALRKSMRMTKGYKLKLFLADILIGVGLFVAVLVLTTLSRIRYLGIIFILVLALLYLAAILFLPIFCGLVRTAFFDEISANYQE